MPFVSFLENDEGGKYVTAWGQLYAHSLGTKTPAFFAGDDDESEEEPAAEDAAYHQFKDDAAFQEAVVMIGEKWKYHPLYILILNEDCVYYDNRPIAEQQANITETEKRVRDALTQDAGGLIEFTAKTIVNYFNNYDGAYDDNVQRFLNLFRETPVWDLDDVRCEE